MAENKRSVDSLIDQSVARSANLLEEDRVQRVGTAIAVCERLAEGEEFDGRTLAFVATMGRLKANDEFEELTSWIQDIERHVSRSPTQLAAIFKGIGSPLLHCVGRLDTEGELSYILHEDKRQDSGHYVLGAYLKFKNSVTTGTPLGSPLEERPNRPFYAPIVEAQIAPVLFTKSTHPGGSGYESISRHEVVIGLGNIIKRVQDGGDYGKVKRMGMVATFVDHVDNRS